MASCTISVGQELITMNGTRKDVAGPSPESLLDFAKASQRMEGLEMTADAQDVCLRMLRGELTYGEAKRILLSKYKLSPS